MTLSSKFVLKSGGGCTTTAMHYFLVFFKMADWEEKDR